MQPLGAQFGDEQVAIGVPRAHRGLDHHRFAGDQFEPVAGRQLERLRLVGRRQGRHRPGHVRRLRRERQGDEGSDGAREEGVQAAKGRGRQRSEDWSLAWITAGKSLSDWVSAG